MDVFIFKCRHYSYLSVFFILHFSFMQMFFSPEDEIL